MTIVNLKEIVEAYAHKFFKENEKEYYRQLGRNCGWKEMHKEINWRNLR